MPTVNANALAAEMDLRVVRVHQLAALGMPEHGRGKYDLVACLKWLVRYQKLASPTGFEPVLPP